MSIGLSANKLNAGEGTSNDSLSFKDFDAPPGDMYSAVVLKSRRNKQGTKEQAGHKETSRA